MSSLKTPSKNIARLEARVSPEIKALWQKAADLEGRTLTDFVIASVQASACQAIARHQSLKLNLEDSETFVQAILNPSEPNARLRAAALRHQQMLRG